MIVWTEHCDPPAKPREEIIITMLDGSEKKGISWETSPMDIAKEVSKSLSERIVIAKVCQNLRKASVIILTINRLMIMSGI